MTNLERNTNQSPTRTRPNLERQAIVFTVGLYLFLSIALLAVHYATPQPPPNNAGSSSTSPFNP